MPQHKRLQPEQQVSVEEYQMPLKTRGLPGGGGGGLVAGLRVGRPVAVLPHWGVITVASHWPLGTQPPLAMRALNIITSYLNALFALYSELC